MTAINAKFNKFLQPWRAISKSGLIIFLQNLILYSKFISFFVLWSMNLKPKLDVWKFKGLLNSFGNFSYWKLETFVIDRNIEVGRKKSILQHIYLNCDTF